MMENGGVARYPNAIMGMMARLGAAVHGNVLVRDSLGVLLCALPLLATATSLGNTPGLLFDFSGSGQAAWTCVQLLPLAFRRRYPQAAALSYVALTAVHLIVGPMMTLSDLFSLPMLYSAIVYDKPQRTHAYLVTAFVMGTAAAATVSWTSSFGPLFPGTATDDGSGFATYPDATYVLESRSMLITNFLTMCAMVYACLLSAIVIAYWQRARMATVRMMQERNAAIEAREQEERRIAALAERARIARDMHDVVAHTLSIIIVQSDGGRYAGAHDPDLARSTMRTIRHEAERAMHDMRRLLSVFGGTGSCGYDDIDVLVEQAKDASPDCIFTRVVQGKPDVARLSDQESGAAYHAVQESLTNVRKYAGPGVTTVIREDWHDDTFDITIEDDGRGAAAASDEHRAGYGLLGMRERVEAAGGHMTNGPKTGGGYAVSISLPLCPTGIGDVASPASHTDAPRNVRFMPSRVSPPTLPSLSNVAAACARFRSRHIDQAVPSSDGRRNMVERLSQWAERHYLLVDTAIAVMLLIWASYMLYASYGGFAAILASDAGTKTSYASEQLITVMMLAPLATRRRFPETSALAVAVFAALQLVFLIPVINVNVLALCSLYSAVLYGRKRAWLWTGIASIVDALLVGLKVGASTSGYFTLFDLFIGIRRGAPPSHFFGFSMLTTIAYAAGLALTCFGVIAAASWQRSSGTNVLVLQAREDALRAEQEKQRILAANMERDRIGAHIQEEVAQTLTMVIDQTDAGLRMLDGHAANGGSVSSADIAAAFEAIGSQGRAALAHMRQLLGVLRETGFSDADQGSSAPVLRLRPAKSLDEQLHDAADGATR